MSHSHDHGDDHGHDHGHDDPGHGGHGHEHSHGHHHHAVGNAGEKRLWQALAVLGAFTAIEAAGGLWANSIALLAEAVHMLADCGSLLLAIVAIRVSQRPPRADRTYGHSRYQPLAAYTNGLILLMLTVGVVLEAVHRLLAPPEVEGRVMLAVAITGGIANLCALLLLAGGRSLNERGARAHVLSDLLGSCAAVVAAGVVLLFHWLPADPLLSLVVSVLILRSGWQVTRDAAHVLLEGAPAGFDASRVERELTGLPGVSGVHHVHAWSLTGEAPIVTLHADLAHGADRQAALAQVLGRLRERFGIEHATVQFEEEGHCADPEHADGCHDPV
jgi:cobalt-zinc-cadmium efflux system protein